MADDMKRQEQLAKAWDSLKAAFWYVIVESKLGRFADKLVAWLERL